MVRQWVTVREHARLTTSACEESLDEASVSPDAFEWLCKLQSSYGKQGARLIEVENRCWLRLDNYVGVISTPCGTNIEILPKHYEKGDSLEKSRALLCKLISSALNISHRETSAAELSLFRYPLTEWVMRQFLNALNVLLKRGLRFDYRQVEEEQRYLRGQLNMGQQIRQPPGRQHLFPLRHAIFVPDRPENRLLRRAVDKIARVTKEPENWRLAHELSGLMRDIAPSQQVKIDFSSWRCDRLMAHYRAIKPWCEVILGEYLPLAVSGQSRGISLLFPMERLFEQHVAAVLQRRLTEDATLCRQAASQYLCKQNGDDVFLLKPDIVVDTSSKRWVVDTKWKRLYGEGSGDKYALKESDFYQMLAYGLRYMDGEGDMILIYPKTHHFAQPLSPFTLPARLRLHVWPFDLDNDELITSEECALPLGENDPKHLRG